MANKMSAVGGSLDQIILANTVAATNYCFPFTAIGCMIQMHLGSDMSS